MSTKHTRRAIVFFLFLMLAPLAHAQEGRYDGIVIGPKGPVAGAQIAVCTQPANTTTTPCSPLATLFTSSSGAVQAANPITADALGNFHFYAAPGTYTVQSYGPSIPTPFVQADQTIASTGSTNAAIKPLNNDAIQYLSNNGADGNDGLSWGTAKLTNAAACAALPSGNSSCSTGTGTVFIAPGFSGTLLSSGTANVALVHLTGASVGNLGLLNVANTWSAVQIFTGAIQTSSGNTAATGNIRMASGDSLAWRNAGNSADIALAKNGSDLLTYSGSIVPTQSGSVTAGHGAIWAANGSLQDGGGNSVVIASYNVTQSSTVTLTQNTFSTILSQAITMPAACPCHVLIMWSLYNSGGGSTPGFSAAVTDGTGTGEALAAAQNASGGNTSGFGATQYSPNTYSGNVTFTLVATSSASSGASIPATPLNVPSGYTAPGYMTILVFRP